MGSPPWAKSFEVEGDPDGRIVLRQIDRKSFELGSTITYIGAETGLEGKLADAELREIRRVSPERLPLTDLTSVPGPLQWLVTRYGVHTPAALIHDWLIGPGPSPIVGLTDQDADRYFRFMLSDLGVRWIRRWMMWAAVALRTRNAARGLRRVTLVVWAVAALVGMVGFVIGLVTGSPVLIVITTVAPLLFSLLWGKQYGAGLVASYAAPWVGPPTVIGALGYFLYWLAETLIRVVSRDRPGAEPYRYRDF